MGVSRAPMAISAACVTPRLFDRLTRQGWNVTDCRRARRQCRRWDERVVALQGRRAIMVGCRITNLTLSGELIAVGIRRRVSIGERLQESDDLVFLFVCQSQ